LIPEYEDPENMAVTFGYDVTPSIGYEFIEIENLDSGSNVLYPLKKFVINPTSWYHLK